MGGFKELQRLGVPVVLPNREVGASLADHLAMFTWFMAAGGPQDKIDPEHPQCHARELLNLFYNLSDGGAGDGALDAEVRVYGGCNEERKTYDFGLEAVLLHPESRGRVKVRE